jgi:hypothetical protein
MNANVNNYMTFILQYLSLDTKTRRDITFVESHCWNCFPQRLAAHVKFRNLFFCYKNEGPGIDSVGPCPPGSPQVDVIALEMIFAKLVNLRIRSDHMNTCYVRACDTRAQI